MGALDEQSQAIGQLQTGVANLERALIEHSRRDEEYRRERDRKSDDFQTKALSALEKLDSVITTQDGHSEKIESLESSRSRAHGVMAAIGAIGTVIATGATLFIQWITTPGSGQ
jgi:hypothetical protein